jgi:hypothetical protein
MELEEMRERWMAADGREAARPFDTLRLRAALTNRSRTATARLTRLVAIELVADLVAVVWLGWFIGANVGDARFVVPAALLDVGAVLLVITCVRQLVALGGLDYGDPVVAIQRRLEELRRERLTTVLVTLSLGPLAWTPLVVVVVRGFLGVDPYAVFGPAWLAWNVAFGLGVVAAAALASRLLAERVRRPGWVRWLFRTLSGAELVEAAAALDALTRFEERPAA